MFTLSGVVVLKGMRLRTKKLRKSQLSTYFAHFQVVIAKKIDIKIIFTGQINIAVDGKYLLQGFQVIIANKL